MRGTFIKLVIFLLCLVVTLLIGKWLRDTPESRAQHVGFLRAVSSTLESLQTSQEMGCPPNPRHGGTPRLSMFVQPDVPRKLLTYVVNGSNPNTHAWFSLTASEVNISSVQTFQIPVCPDTCGWILFFHTDLPNFSGLVGYCTFGHNLERLTPLKGEGVLLHSYLSPSEGCGRIPGGSIGYLTQTW